VAVAPIWWRARGQLGMYADAAPHIDHATRNARVLARRAVSGLRAAEPVPAALPASVDALAEAVRRLHAELERGEVPAAARRQMVEAARQSGMAYAAGVGFSGSVVVAQVGSVAVDLLRASGLDEPTALRVVRRLRREAEAATHRR